MPWSFDYVLYNALLRRAHRLARPLICAKRDYFVALIPWETPLFRYTKWITSLLVCYAPGLLTLYQALPLR